MQRALVGLFLLLASTGCGDASGAGGAGGANPTSSSAAGTSGSGTTGTSTSATGTASTGTGSGMGTGSCLAPRDVSLGFAAATDASTANQLDAVTLTCNPGGTLPEAVYRLTLTQMTTVSVMANDHSGQGIGVQVRADSCNGQSVACDWQSNGIVNRSYPLPPGTWLFILERNPAGPFTFSIGP